MKFNYFNIADLGVGLFWLILLYVIAFNIRNKNAHLPHYKYYLGNFSFKVIFALAFSLFYIVSYQGGDTVAYFEVSKSLNKLLLENPAGWWEQMVSEPSNEMYSRLFNLKTGYPPGWIYREAPSLFVSKIISLIAIITFNSYWATTFIIAFLVSAGSWKLFELALSLKMHKERLLAYGVLFIPSVSFWCAGISKDAIAFWTGLMLIYHLFQIISVERKKSLKNLFYIFAFSFLILNTRSFFLAAILLPAFVVFAGRLLKIIGMKPGAIIASYIILTLIGLLLFGATLSNQSEEELLQSNEFLQEAQIIQQDFAINTTYGVKRYSLGEISFTPLGIVSALPISVFAGIFYPLPWQALSPSLILNGLESFLLILLTLNFIFNKPFLKLSKINSEDLLLYSLLFVIIVAFMAGFTSMLYGVLVRIRAPLLPFLFILLLINRANTEEKRETSALL